MMIKDSEENLQITELSSQIMTERLRGNEEIKEKFIPRHAFGCRRLTPGDGYLETCQSNHARAELSPIKRIIENGIDTEAGFEEFDLIVCATGYIVDFVLSWGVVGLGGRELNSTWLKSVATGLFRLLCARNAQFLHVP